MYHPIKVSPLRDIRLPDLRLKAEFLIVVDWYSVIGDSESTPLQAWSQWKQLILLD